MEQRPAIDPEHLWRAPEEIVLLPHEPRWIAAAEQEGRRIAEACGSAVIRVEHIGSTAVPGLIAKPVIDLMPLVSRFEDGFGCVGAMRSLGYWYAGEFGIGGRHFFVRGSPRTHHAHMLVDGSLEAKRHMAARNALREHEAMRERYAALKRELAGRFGNDREGYAEAKGAFMRELFALAGIE